MGNEINSEDIFPIEENTDVVMELDWAQITYSLRCKRILFVNYYKIWSNFYTENGYKYIDYTPEELSHRFLQRILPNIYEYELTEEELLLLSLLDLHPNYVRTNSGFELKQIESLTFPSNEAAIEPFTTQTRSSYETNFVGNDVNENRQILISSPSEQYSIYHTFNFSVENSTLLSAVLCSDEDLPNCELLNKGEFHNRLKAAKCQFESNGQQLENMFLDDLLKKLKSIKKLKVAVVELLDKSFRENSFEI